MPDLRYRVFILAQHALMADGIAALLDTKRFLVLGSAATSAEAQRKLAGQKVDLLVVQAAKLPDVMDSNLRSVIKTLVGCKLVWVAEEACGSNMAQALELGVKAYLTRNNGAEALNHAMGLVAMGESVYPTRELQNGLQHLSNGKHVMGLTQREQEILKYIARGESNKSIALALNLSEGTVKVHVKAVLKKLNVQNRTQAAIFAHNQGDMS